MSPGWSRIGAHTGLCIVDNRLAFEVPGIFERIHPSLGSLRCSLAQSESCSSNFEFQCGFTTKHIHPCHSDSGGPHHISFLVPDLVWQVLERWGNEPVSLRHFGAA